MDYSTLPRYPPHPEPAASQSERLAGAAGPTAGAWALIAAAVVAGSALLVLAGVWAAVGASGLAG